MAINLGSRLGPYEIVAPIGAGGMGEVYRARDTRLDRTVAIKVLPEALQADPEFRERFDREARSIAALNHPNICTVHDVGDDRGAAYIVMELLSGETLAARLGHGALPLDEALRVAIDVAAALEAAHRAGIVHRDLKPGNIMLMRGGPVRQAKLLDFGLAKTGSPVVANAAETMAPTVAELTAQGTILGTFQYMSPEQLDGQPADARADIFAFGAVLYEMLTGKKAFAGKSRASLIGAIMHATPPPIALAQPLAPLTLDRIVRTCLAKDPDQRWQSAGDLKRELQWIADGGSTSTGSAPVGRSRTREYAAWGLAGVATLVAVAVSILYLWASPQPNELVRFDVTAPTGLPLADRGFALSPNGKTLAFTARGSDGVFRLFVRHLDSTTAQPLVGTEDPTFPFWSPDSRSLGFGRGIGIYRVDLDGSTPRRLCEVAVNSFHGGTWSHHGTVVFASESGGLRSVPDTGGVPTPVTTTGKLPVVSGAADGFIRHLEPWFLPDGRHVLFLAMERGTHGVVWAASLDGSAPTRIAESSAAPAYTSGWLLTASGVTPRTLLAQPFDPDRLTLSGTPQTVPGRIGTGSTVALRGFAVSADGVLVVGSPAGPTVATRQLLWLDRAGQTIGTVPTTAGFLNFALAPDERRVVATVADAESGRPDLWLFGDGTDTGRRLTFTGAVILQFGWAPDGRHVYFTEFRQGEGLPLRVVDVGAATTTTFGAAGWGNFYDATRDGRYLVILNTGGVLAQHLSDASNRRVLVPTPPFANHSRVSRDNRWLSYTRELPSGKQVFVQPFDRPADRIQVSSTGGFGAVWRDDGRELFYESPEGMMAVTMSEQGGKPKAGLPQRLFAVRTQGFAGNGWLNMAVAAHGQKFLVNTMVGDANVPLEVTMNWTAGLRK